MIILKNEIIELFICMNMPKSLIKYDAASNALKKETKTV